MNNFRNLNCCICVTRTQPQRRSTPSVWKSNCGPFYSENKVFQCLIDLPRELKTVSVWFQNKRQTERKAGRLPTSSSSSSENSIVQSSLTVVSSPSQNKTLTKRRAPRQDGDSCRYNSLRREPPRPDMPHGAYFRRSQGSPGNEKERPAGHSSSNVHEYSIGPRQEIWRHFSSSSTTGSESRRYGTSQVPSKNTTDVLVNGSASAGSNHKRSRTLEWACDRQAKRRRSNREETTTPRAKDKDDSACRRGAEFESAMSLLALPGSSLMDMPEDVLRAATLLLCFKYSVRAPRYTNTTELAI